MTTDPTVTDPTPAEQLAALLGDTNARAAITAGWDAIRRINADFPAHNPIVRYNVADYVATVVILAALPTLKDNGNDMYRRAYFEVQEVLNDALGTEEEDGAGMGLAADVRLLAQRYADLKKAIVRGALAPSHWEQRIAEIEASPLRCSHGVPMDDDCRQCIADVMAQIQPKETTR